MRPVGAGIEVCSFDLDACPLPLEERYALLAPEEVARAERFYRDRDRLRYSAGRLALRRVLGRHTGLDPRALRFEYGQHGKPTLADHADVAFNLSHSRNEALLAVGDSPALGVDIEALEAFAELEAIAHRFFTAHEVEQIRSAGPFAPELFFRCWTRKEAYLKAVGGGLSIPLTSVEVEILGAPRIRAIEGSAEAGSSWSVHHLATPNGYVGALVVHTDRSPSVRSERAEWSSILRDDDGASPAASDNGA